MIVIATSTITTGTTPRSEMQKGCGLDVFFFICAVKAVFGNLTFLPSAQAINSLNKHNNAKRSSTERKEGSCSSIVLINYIKKTKQIHLPKERQARGWGCGNKNKMKGKHFFKLSALSYLCFRMSLVWVMHVYEYVNKYAGVCVSRRDFIVSVCHAESSCHSLLLNVALRMFGFK